MDEPIAIGKTPDGIDLCNDKGHGVLGYLS